MRNKIQNDVKSQIMLLYLKFRFPHLNIIISCLLSITARNKDVVKGQLTHSWVNVLKFKNPEKSLNIDILIQSVYNNPFHSDGLSHPYILMIICMELSILYFMGCQSKIL